MASEFSWQNSISLCLASFSPPRPNKLARYSVTLDFLLLHSVPMMKRPSFLGVLEGLGGLQRTVQVQLFQH